MNRKPRHESERPPPTPRPGSPAKIQWQWMGDLCEAQSQTEAESNLKEQLVAMIDGAGFPEEVFVDDERLGSVPRRISITVEIEL